ncbi:MAG: hypothetical protein JXR30_03555 [Alphaproteobacteria bacterium]|nr:hypothetical protein [Alphaproteobacteria bacterium]
MLNTVAGGFTVAGVLDKNLMYDRVNSVSENDIKNLSNALNKPESKKNFETKKIIHGIIENAGGRTRFSNLDDFPERKNAQSGVVEARSGSDLLTEYDTNFDSLKDFEKEKLLNEFLKQEVHIKTERKLGYEFKPSIGAGFGEKTDRTYLEQLAVAKNKDYISTYHEMNDKVLSTYKTRYNRYAGWSLEGERPNNALFMPKVGTKLLGDNIAGDLTNLVLAPILNIANATTVFQYKRWDAELRNRAQALDDFAQKYFPEEYDQEMTANDKDEMQTEWPMKKLARLRRFWKKRKRDHLQNPEQFAELIKRVQGNYLDTNIANNKDFQKELQTLSFIGRRFFNDNFWMRNFGHMGIARIFENDEQKIQRRILQFARAGGNYMAHMGKAVEAGENIIRFLKAQGQDLSQPPFEDLKTAYDALQEAKKVGGESVLTKHKNDFFDALQKADLRKKKNHKAVQSMINKITDSQLSKDAKINAIQQLNFLTTNVSSRRREWWRLDQRIFPRIRNSNRNREHSDLTRMFNVALNKSSLDTQTETGRQGYNKELAQFIMDNFKTVVDATTGKAYKAEDFGIDDVALTGEFKAGNPLKRFWKGVQGKGFEAEEKQKFNEYVRILNRSNSFVDYLNQNMTITTQDPDGRRRIGTEGENIRHIGLLYLEATHHPDAAENISIADKSIIKSFTNKRIDSLSNQGYMNIKQNANNMRVVEKNLPFYIALHSLKYTISKFIEYYNRKTADSEYVSKKVQEFENISQRVEDLIRKLKGNVSEIYKTDLSFTQEFESLVKEIQDSFEQLDNIGGDEARWNKYVEKNLDIASESEKKDVPLEKEKELNQKMGQLELISSQDLAIADEIDLQKDIKWMEDFLKELGDLKVNLPERADEIKKKFEDETQAVKKKLEKEIRDRVDNVSLLKESETILLGINVSKIANSADLIKQETELQNLKSKFEELKNFFDKRGLTADKTKAEDHLLAIQTIEKDLANKKKDLEKEEADKDKKQKDFEIKKAGLGIEKETILIAFMTPIDISNKQKKADEFVKKIDELIVFAKAEGLSFSEKALLQESREILEALEEARKRESEKTI